MNLYRWRLLRNVGIAASILGVIYLLWVSINLSNAVHNEQNARETTTCETIPDLTFRSTQALHDYEQRRKCKVGGTVPVGGGSPVDLPISGPSPSSPTDTPTAPATTAPAARTSAFVVASPTHSPPAPTHTAATPRPAPTPRTSAASPVPSSPAPPLACISVLDVGGCL